MYAPKDPTPTLLRWLGWFLLFWLVVCLVNSAKAQPLRAGLVVTAAPAKLSPRAQQSFNAKRTVAWLTARQYIREATGHNDGPQVGAIVKAGGGVPAQKPEWCGFTQAADQLANGLPIPARGMQGAARAWFTDITRTFYKVGVRGVSDSIRVGHQLGFDYGRGIHHIGRAVEVVPPLRAGRPPRGFYSIAGNEGRGANAGVHRTFYATPNIAAASNWLY